jgi:hypothetical protein
MTRGASTMTIRKSGRRSARELNNSHGRVDQCRSERASRANLCVQVHPDRYSRLARGAIANHSARVGPPKLTAQLEEAAEEWNRNTPQGEARLSVSREGDNEVVLATGGGRTSSESVRVGVRYDAPTGIFAQRESQSPGSRDPERSVILRAAVIGTIRTPVVMDVAATSRQSLSEEQLLERIVRHFLLDA